MELLVSLILFAVVTTVTPGGANLMAAASGMRFGWRRSLPLLLGIALGLAILVAMTATGLGALLQSVPALQLAMRVAGSAYLIWLAWRIGRSGAPNIAADNAATPSSFVAGLLLPWLNPKAWSMALAAAAAYAGLTLSPPQLALLLATTFGLAAFPALSLWCAGGSMLARTLRSETQWRAVNAGLGLLLAASIAPMWR